jgi:3-oxoacyl-[acyl-carrier protein] reductase
MAVVSGGSKGLGAALARDLLARGWAVATFSRARTPAIDELESQHADAFLWEPVDAADFEAAGRVVTSAARRFGRLDALVNNAAIMHTGTLPMQRPADIHEMITVNLETPIHLARIAARVMVHRRAGCIVNVSTVNAVRGANGVAVYAATKGGLDALTRSLARELGPRGVRVNSVVPGFFQTEMTTHVTDEARDKIRKRTPLGRLGQVEDVVAAIRFLLSPEASFITGQLLVVDGGLTC